MDISIRILTLIGYTRISRNPRYPHPSPCDSRMCSCSTTSHRHTSWMESPAMKLAQVKTCEYDKTAIDHGCHARFCRSIGYCLCLLAMSQWRHKKRPESGRWTMLEGVEFASLRTYSHFPCNRKSNVFAVLARWKNIWTKGPILVFCVGRGNPQLSNTIFLRGL